MVRVVVGDNATEDEIIEASKSGFLYLVNADLGECIEDIEDDEIIPFGEGIDDHKYIDV